MHEVMTCPLCRHDQFQALQGYDRKVGPEIFEFIKSPYKLSQWALCRRCGFCFQNPRPSPDDVENIYSSGLYRAKREYGEYYFQTRYTRPFEHFRWLSQYATWEAPPRILDIGAGYGGAVRAFQDLGARAEGIEIDAALCAAAPERFEVTLINGDFLTYQFEEGAYDVVYSAHTHEHFDDFVTVNKRIHSLLKPDGHLLLILPTFRFFRFETCSFTRVVTYK